MSSSNNLNDIDLKKLIKDAKSIAIISHIRPDGDTIGASLSLYEVCKELGKTPIMMCESKIPEYLSFIESTKLYVQTTDKKFDLVCAIDCGSISRVGNLTDVFESANITVDVDHHPSNENFGTYNLVEREASSTCQVLYGLYKRNNITLTQKISQHLYTGLSTDTGNFMHSSVNRDVFLMAAELAGNGVDINFLNQNLYKQSTRQRLRLLAHGLSKIQYHCGDRLTTLQLNFDDLEKCGVSPEESEGIVSYCVNIKGVVAGAIMTQIGDDQYKVSFRSHPGIDCSTAANSFGGGGHKQAAGCLVSGSPEEVYEKVTKALTDLVDCLA